MPRDRAYAESNYGFSMRRILLILVLVGLLATAGGLWYLYRAPYAAGSRFAPESEAAVAVFAAKASPSRVDYETLAGYLIEGFLTYATPSHALAKYPGLPAGGARKAEELEGFSRIAPLLGVWLEHRAASPV